LALKKLEFSDILDILTSFKEKGAKLTVKWVGLRFLSWHNEKLSWGKRTQDLIQNVLMLANGVLALVFAEKWNGNNNP
jgi:hypothetical protein